MSPSRHESLSQASLVSDDESYASRKDKADMVDPSCCILEFKEPSRLVVLGQEVEREGVGSCVVGRSVSCGG